jgi:F0F1-type ATP synthase delta subunit
MKNLTQEEKDYILKVLNYDLKIAKKELDGWEKTLKNLISAYKDDFKFEKELNKYITKFKNKIEFLTKLINKF